MIKYLFCLIILLFSQSSFALELVDLLTRQVPNYCATINGWCGLTTSRDRGGACSKLTQVQQGAYGFNAGHSAVSSCSGYFYAGICDPNVGYCNPSDPNAYSQIPLAIASITDETYCPDNSGPHDATTCECNTGFVANAAKTACEPPPNEEACPVGTHHSTGMFDWGLVKSHDKARVCDPATQCYLIFEGGNKGKTATVGGETHFFAVGSYYHLGSKCTPSSTNGVPLAMTSPPVESCGLNQVAITSTTGKLNCYKSDGTKVGASSAVPAAQSAADIAAKNASIEQAAAEAGETAAEAVKAAGGDQAAQDKAKHDAVAQTVTKLMGGSSDTGTACQGADCPQIDVSKLNQEETQKRIANAMEKIASGVPSLDLSMDGVTDEGIGKQTVNVSNGLFDHFSITGSITCPAPRVLNLGITTVSFDFSSLCNFLTGLRPIVLAAAFFAAAMILIR